MKTIYEFYFNGRYYRSTDRDVLDFFADLFAMAADIKAVGLSNYDIELERV